MNATLRMLAWLEPIDYLLVKRSVDSKMGNAELMISHYHIWHLTTEDSGRLILPQLHCPVLPCPALVCSACPVLSRPVLHHTAIINSSEKQSAPTFMHTHLGLMPRCAFNLSSCTFHGVDHLLSIHLLSIEAAISTLGPYAIFSACCCCCQTDP
jgi:hypothetical protein